MLYYIQDRIDNEEGIEILEIKFGGISIDLCEGCEDYEHIQMEVSDCWQSRSKRIPPSECHYQTDIPVELDDLNVVFEFLTIVARQLHLNRDNGVHFTTDLEQFGKKIYETPD